MGSFISVIGTIFIDCKGFAREAYLASGRNLGSIQFVHGGVARNVAENMALLGLPVEFVSTVDDSAIGNDVMERLNRHRVHTAYMKRTGNLGMGMWLAILERDGNLAGSISQMPELKHLEQLLAEKGEEIVQASSHVVLELDLNVQLSRTVLQLAKKLNKPVYGIPGNLDVILSDTTMLQEVDCFICNNFEAERLMGKSLAHLTPEQMLELLRAYADENGLTSMVITLGAQGSIFYDARTRESGYQPVFPVNMVDSTGAGDAFFSGTVMGLVRGLSLKEAVVCGTKVAGWTIESKENTCLELPEKIKQDAWFQNLLASV